MDNSTLLYRQVHPDWIQQGRVSSQVFRPTPKDEHKLSVYDGNQIDAQDAWSHYTETLGHRSAGVLAVTVQECRGQELVVSPDPEPFPEHALIDFSGHSQSRIRKKAKALRSLADERGWQFGPV
ncbi:hypothetical protein Mal4_05900 [Maioricimonas rarisocia]|uniref:Uncharacterized protein n=1 Tax=Maioricimonas rarisocia TaxID=2528026 RepID=A0A517Z1G3_9PLAN|nr:hypothetical protein [Maioricimonas rarisocia]QDU36305.1 hypothetical protein Mal4_05900 [Maioricimonas rarisocia]